MDKQFEALFGMLKQPLKHGGGIKTDNSIRMVYPPEKELDFRERLLDTFVPMLESEGIDFRLLDLTGFLFEAIDENEVPSFQEDEFENYRLMKQGLSKRLETRLVRRLAELAEESPGGTIFLYGTVALYPLLRFGEILKDIRKLNCRVVITVPGEERNGTVYFLDQPDSGNYLAVKLT
jgi:hypothetical protein